MFTEVEYQGQTYRVPATGRDECLDDMLTEVPDDAHAMAFLMQAGDLAVPCSRYGSSTSDCAVVAIALSRIMAEETREPRTYHGLDHDMGLVVNDHSDVGDTIREYGTTADRELAGVVECECSDDLGPCERHADTLVIREGASLRTADELALLLIEDLRDCGVVLTADQATELERLNSRLENDRDPHSGVAWFDDLDDSVAADELAREVENDADGLWVTYEDGYVISRPHNDCPLIAS